MAGIADVVGIAAAVAKAVPGTAGAKAAAAQAAAEAAADHCDDVLESIPEDYSTLSGDVGDLKSHVNDIQKETGILVLPGEYHDTDVLFTSSDFASGTVMYYSFSAVTGKTGYIDILDSNNQRITYIGKGASSSGSLDYEGKYTLPANYASVVVRTGDHITVNYMVSEKSNKEQYQRTETILDSLINDNLVSVATLTNGYIKASDGSFVSDSSYRATNFFKVRPGEQYYYKSYTSTSVFAVAMYASTSSNADTSKSVIGTGSENGGVITIPDGINYIRVTVGSAYIANVVLAKSTSQQEIINKFGEYIAKEIKLTLATGYIKSADGSFVSTSGYKTSSEFIPVTPGEKYTLTSRGSSSVFILGFYTTNSGNADTTKSVAGSDEVVTFTFEVPTGFNYIRVCCADSYVSSLKLVKIGDVYNKIDEINERIDEIEQGNATETKFLSAEHRVATINFQFDDGVSKDDDIYAIFHAKGLPCGFALISTVSQARVPTYLNYQTAGFEILSHSTDSNPMNDPSASAETIETKLKNSRKTLEGYGFNIRGFVTPSSAMASVFIPIAEKYYDFAATVYYGTYDGTGTPYQPKTTETCKLFRVSVQSTTLANMKKAVDEAIENNGFLTFYGHAADLDTTDYETTENLNELLTYINTKIADLQCYCLKPSDAVDYYFHVRHSDYLELLS